MIFSNYAGKLRCVHCGKTQGSTKWPKNGDYVPMYFQGKPGSYTLPVDCPHCRKAWYVVWDDYPGEFGPVAAI